MVNNLFITKYGFLDGKYFSYYCRNHGIMGIGGSVGAGNAKGERDGQKPTHSIKYFKCDLVYMADTNRV